MKKHFYIVNGEESFGRLCSSEIRMEMDCGVGWNVLDQHRIQWQDLGMAVMNGRAYVVGYFFFV
jgi:hypothetical protein